MTGTAREAADAPVGGRPSLLPCGRLQWGLVATVLAVAVVLRIGVALGTAYTPLTDAADFDRIASSIAGGHGYGDAVLPGAHGPSALRAPLYPVSLSLTYLLSGGHNWMAGRLVNALLGAAVVALVGVVAAQLWSRRVALVAMALAAVHPAMIVVGSGLQLEPLLVTLTLGALAAALQHGRDRRVLLWPLVAGLLVGLAILTRELGFLLIPPLAWLLWTGGPRPRRPRGRGAVAAPLIMATLAVAMVVPWTIRNAVQLRAFVPVTTSAGFGLAGTYNETSQADRVHPAQWIPPYRDPAVARILTALPDPTEVAIDAALRGESVDVARAHPAYPARVVFYNTLRLFDLDGGDASRLAARYLPYPPRLTQLAIDGSYIAVVLAVAGAFQLRARRTPRAVWAIPILVGVFMVVFLPANIRYRASIEPFVVLLAALTVEAALGRLMAARGRRRSSALPQGPEAARRRPPPFPEPPERGSPRSSERIGR